VTEAGGEATVEVWPEMVHVWHASAGFVPESDAALDRIAAVTRPRLGQHAGATPGTTQAAP
jgi:acetyl esterase/lipase